MIEEKLKRGTQIIYVPNHADGDVEHEDCERGFVITDKGESAFCRYWARTELTLRTLSCSELTPKANLVVKKSRGQKFMDILIKNDRGDRRTSFTW